LRFFCFSPEGIQKGGSLILGGRMEESRSLVGMPLTAIDVRNQVNLIQEVMRDVMQEGQHYGKVPGCGDKPTLLKPGAEKLSMTFRLRPIMNNNGDIIIENLANGHREVTVYCHILNMAGQELSTGIGSCSTMESKYRYRGGEKIGTGQPLPKEYWNLKKEGKGTEAQALIGGSGYGPGKIDGVWQVCEIGDKMENPDIADTFNTVLKMAKKRAYVDGILSATAASDIFTQDIEDFPENAHPVTEKPAAVKPSVSMPQAKEPKPTPAPEQAVDTSTEAVDPTALGVVQALKQPDKAKFNTWGILFSYKVRSVKTKKGQMDITDYKLNQDGGNEQIEISKFGKPPEGLANDDVVTFTDVVVSTYNGELKYLAQEVAIIEKGEQNAG
jgi:hypothetical protein